MNEKERFILSEIMDSTIRAGFMMNPVYSTKNTKERESARCELKILLLSYYLKGYNKEKRTNSKEHINEIEKFQKGICSIEGFKDNLNFGTAQKLLNLFLKYLWICKDFSIPPHCPFDSIVLKKLKEKKYKQLNNSNLTSSWTKRLNKNDYENCLDVAARVTTYEKFATISEWELHVWNGINKANFE